MAIDSSRRSESPEFSSLAIDVDLTPLPEYKKAGTTTLDFDGLLSAPLRLHEDLSSGCGGQLWPAGMVLATHMLRYHRDRLADARILELGAGGGLVSLAVARGCQDIKTQILVTDQEEMFSLMEHNIRLNGVEDRAKAMLLNWYAHPWTVIISTSRPSIPLSPSFSVSPPCVHFLFPRCCEPDGRHAKREVQRVVASATFFPIIRDVISPPGNDRGCRAGCMEKHQQWNNGLLTGGDNTTAAGSHWACRLPNPSPGFPIRGEELPQEVVESRPNVILAADCVYFEPAFPLLQKTMADLLMLCPEATIYFCFKKRRRADMQFLKKAQKLFSVVEVADQARPVFSREGLFLYAISSKQRQQPGGGGGKNTGNQ
ncbi:hypothetical protein RB595_002746 [Gaeumannomyces hyphopodioides]